MFMLQHGNVWCQYVKKEKKNYFEGLEAVSYIQVCSLVWKLWWTELKWLPTVDFMIS